MRFRDVERYPNAWLATLSHEDIANADFPVITDRTQADVDYVDRLSEKGWDSMTDREKIEYIGGLKGAYNAIDLNRVGYAINYLSNWLGSMGYMVDANGRTDWMMKDAFGPDEETAYLAKVRRLRNALAIPFDTPQVPPDMENFLYNEANDIERILANIEATLVRMESVYIRAGMPWAVCSDFMPYIAN